MSVYSVYVYAYSCLSTNDSVRKVFVRYGKEAKCILKSIFETNLNFDSIHIHIHPSVHPSGQKSPECIIRVKAQSSFMKNYPKNGITTHNTLTSLDIF